MCSICCLLCKLQLYIINGNHALEDLAPGNVETIRILCRVWLHFFALGPPKQPLVCCKRNALELLRVNVRIPAVWLEHTIVPLACGMLSCVFSLVLQVL